MATKEYPIVVGVFAHHHQAFQALAALEQAGFGADQVGFLTRREEDLSGEVTAATPDLATVMAGAAAGGAAGSLLGAGTALLIPGVGPAFAGGILLATLWGAGIGAVSGSLIGAFTSVGVPEEEARHYQEALARGYTLVTVDAGPRPSEALRLLRQQGASKAEARPSRPGLHTPSSGPAVPPEPEPYVHPRKDTPVMRPDEPEDRLDQPTPP